MTDKETKILALHNLLKENFTDEQRRILLVSALEQICNYDYEKIVTMLDNFHMMFNPNK